MIEGHIDQNKRARGIYPRYSKWACAPSTLNLIWFKLLEIMNQFGEFHGKYWVD